MIARVKYESKNMAATAVRKISGLSPVYFVFGAFMLAVSGLILTYHTKGLSTSATSPTTTLAATWNMAAINNNPFEYWITYDRDDSYLKIMEQVSAVMQHPNGFDVNVDELFSSTMFEELMNKMENVEWTGLDKVREIWTNDYRTRKIISGFLTDPIIGKKRLTSMPDRVTNTIYNEEGHRVMRPTVINCYKGTNLSGLGAWWAAWKSFMFETSISDKPAYKMLSKIKHSKYPTLTKEEEEISLPLQTLSLAIFDAILVHLMNHVALETWQPLRQEMCENLNTKKNDISASILNNYYGNHDVIFLQEVSKSFVNNIKAPNAPALNPMHHESRTLSHDFHIHTPSSMFHSADGGSRDQNSVILLKKFRYVDVVDVTSDVMSSLLPKKHRQLKSVPVAEGDLLVLSAYDTRTKAKYLFASFHGDTNGLATVPVLDAVVLYAKTNKADHRLLFGMDANTYEHAEPDQQGMTAFAEYYTSKKLTSSCGRRPNPKNYTTFHARTYLQSQLNKAVSLQDRDKRGDKNPKDFILFFESDYAPVWSKRDNTGDGIYIENMIFPTLTFPSDHAITSTLLVEKF